MRQIYAKAGHISKIKRRVIAKLTGCERYVRVLGHISAMDAPEGCDGCVRWRGTYQKQQRIRVKMGCERRPRAPVCDYTGSDLALVTGL